MSSQKSWKTWRLKKWREIVSQMSRVHMESEDTEKDQIQR